LKVKVARTPFRWRTIVERSEQARSSKRCGRRRRERPVIAIATFNEATEVSDFLSAYGVLRRADVADLTVVAERAEPVWLYSSLASIRWSR
jgi:hypothetical protein